MTTAYQMLLHEFVPRPISSARAYRRTLKQVDGLIRKPRRSRAEDDLLELLATIVRSMLNVRLLVNDLAALPTTPLRGYEFLTAIVFRGLRPRLHDLAPSRQSERRFSYSPPGDIAGLFRSSFRR